jgi:hypothetical protein
VELLGFEIFGIRKIDTRNWRRTASSFEQQATLLGLEKMGKIEPRSATVKEFPKELWEHASTNEMQIRNEAIP